MTIKERLKKYVEFKEMSERQFSLSLGLSANYIYSMRKAPSSDIIRNIAVKYPDLSIDWMLTGQGEMITKTENNFNQNSENDIFEDNIINPQNEDAMEILRKMASVVERQSTQIDRLITQVEKSGERADRMLDLIEHNAHGYAQKKEAI